MPSSHVLEWQWSNPNFGSHKMFVTFIVAKTKCSLNISFSFLLLWESDIFQPASSIDVNMWLSSSQWDVSRMLYPHIQARPTKASPTHCSCCSPILPDIGVTLTALNLWMIAVTRWTLSHEFHPAFCSKGICSGMLSG